MHLHRLFFGPQTRYRLELLAIHLTKLALDLPRLERTWQPQGLLKFLIGIVNQFFHRLFARVKPISSLIVQAVLFV